MVFAAEYVEQLSQMVLSWRLTILFLFLKAVKVPWIICKHYVKDAIEEREIKYNTCVKYAHRGKFSSVGIIFLRFLEKWVPKSALKSPYSEGGALE